MARPDQKRLRGSEMTRVASWRVKALDAVHIKRGKFAREA